MFSLSCNAPSFSYWTRNCNESCSDASITNTKKNVSCVYSIDEWNEEILKTGNRTHSLEDLHSTPTSARRGSTARTLKTPIKALSKLTRSILDLRHPSVQTEKNTDVEDTEPVFEDPPTNSYPLPPLTDYRLTPPPDKPPNYPWSQLRGLNDFSEHLAEAAAAP